MIEFLSENSARAIDSEFIFRKKLLNLSKIWNFVLGCLAMARIGTEYNPIWNFWQGLFLIYN